MPKIIRNPKKLSLKKYLPKPINWLKDSMRKPKWLKKTQRKSGISLWTWTRKTKEMIIAKNNLKLLWEISMMLAICSENLYKAHPSTLNLTISYQSSTQTLKGSSLREEWRLKSYNRASVGRVGQDRICRLCIPISSHNKILGSMFLLRWIWIRKVIVTPTRIRVGKETWEICWRT